MVNFSMAILIRPQPGVDTVRVQLLLIVPGSRAIRKLRSGVNDALTVTVKLLVKSRLLGTEVVESEPWVEV